jgi:capsular polysaccharide export protein
MKPIQTSSQLKSTGLRRVVCAFGFSLRKRPLVRQFCQRNDIRFVTQASQVPDGADLLLWGAAEPPDGLAADVRIVRLEDGFIRSVGLGADLISPLSWVVDTHGIYFDSRGPSDLETLLQTAEFTLEDLDRAAALRNQLVAKGISKYNLSGPAWQRPQGRAQVVLVAGQVETDASIQWGALDVRTNLGLLQAVRQARPDAWVVYKPHPDVVAGLRSAGTHENEVTRWCNEVLPHASMAQLLPLVNEVHVMTSLTGFEALLRGIPVFCHGQPFYAGWGLTTDTHPVMRRTRRLTLDELVAGALLHHPVYLAPGASSPCSAEDALAALLQLKQAAPTRLPLWRRALRSLLARP